GFLALAEFVRDAAGDLAGSTVGVNEDESKPHCFRRMNAGLNLPAFKPSEGYLSLRAGMALCTLGRNDPKITAEKLLQKVEQHLEQAYATNLITEVRIPQLV